MSFAPEVDWSLLDHVRMEQELEEILGRRVDLISRRAVERSENRTRRDAILSSARIIHAYDAVDLDEVWRTVHRDIPDLLTKIEPLIHF